MVTQYREDTLRLSLKSLSEMMSDIRAAVIVNVDGLVVAAYPPHSDDDVHNPTGDQSVAATTALIMGLAERTLARLAQGELERIMIEGTQGTIGVFPCTGDAVLAVLINKDAKLGLALTATRRTANEIKTILGE
ncbi:MAG TPA: roadblock/LC7 domain-containing protein [Anaerolineales bacterium]|nr:roadblock/LC7 domain-containing protein [Anaerolineales bacterium]